MRKKGNCKKTKSKQVAGLGDKEEEKQEQQDRREKNEMK